MYKLNKTIIGPAIIVLTTFLTGCNSSTVYQDYVSQGMTIKNPGGVSGNAEYTFMPKLIKIDKGIAKFKIKVSSNQSNMLVTLKLSEAILDKGNGDKISCTYCTDGVLSGLSKEEKSNNGETQADEIEFEFNDSGLVLGNLRPDAAKKTQQKFSITIPALIPVGNSSSNNKKNSQPTATYPGKANIKLVFTADRKNISDHNFLRGLYSAY